jgi:ribosomal protein S18 acetylase RimI-like enzyme
MATDERAQLHRSIRPATGADAFELASIRSSSRAVTEASASAEVVMREEVDFIDRLSLPHGDDYFCIVAEESGTITGYLIGGGSRDLDRKAHGEIYEIVVLPAARRQGVAHALLSDAIARFDQAAFAGTLLSAPGEDRAVARLTTGVGMAKESVRGHNHETVRYERLLRHSPQGDPRR